MLKQPSIGMTRRAAQRGLSLVELMVGITVGMFVVAAASTVLTTQLVDNRRLMLEVQIQQDLRAAADIMARDLRRADAWGNVHKAKDGIWSNDSPATVRSVQVGIDISGAAGSSLVEFWASRSPTQLGYRRNGDVIESKSGVNWQALTDENTMRVTNFTVVAEDEAPVRALCTKLCADGSQNCWPSLTVRVLRVQITGESRTDSTVQRSVESVVRPRNDQVSFNDPANPGLACPA